MGQQRSSAINIDRGAFENIEKVSLDKPTLITRVRRLFFKSSDIDSLEKLKSYLERSAAFLAYKNVQEYSRSKAGIQWYTLLEDDEFQLALETSVWTTFLISIELVGEMALIVLRQKCRTDPQDLAGLLTRELRGVVEANREYSALPSRCWQEAATSISYKMRTSALVHPKSVLDIAAIHVPNIFVSLPTHKLLRGHDELLLLKGVQMNLLQLQHEFATRANCKSISKLARAS